MKKYLMTGIAALALGAGFTSCSHDIEPITQEDLNKIEAQKVVDNYNQAFIKTFGQPAANQTWGFGTATRAITRTYNVQGNLWHEPKPEGFNLKYDAKVTTEEMNKVFDYVNKPTNVETVNQIPYTNYWVSQIWEGDVNKNDKGEMAPVSHSYPDQNGAITDITGGAQMDKLMIKESANGDWIHCNNFNGATNNDYKEGGEGGRTLMLNSGTYSFGYTNSQASYFSEKYIIVPGEKIDASLKGFYYVCFDFERGYTDAEWAQEETKGSYEAWNGNNYQGGWNFSLKGKLNEDQVKAAIGKVNGKDIQNIVIKGYLYGDKHCDGDGNYTDWIVRISPAEEVKIENSDYDIRVIAEDLNAASTTDKVNSDWDFNDVVFDVKYLDTPVDGNNVKIRVVAAGGTYPLYVAGQEVHALFGKSPNVMINTKASAYGSSYETQELPVFYIKDDNARSSNGKSIMVEVDKGSGKIEMTAEVGKPAAKIGVSPNFNYCMERVDITTQYPLFQTWVTTATPATGWWDSEIGK